MIHKSLNLAEWQKKPFAYQMANIGSEAMRVLYWHKKRDRKNMDEALERFSELLVITLNGQKHSAKARELDQLNKYFCDMISRKRLNKKVTQMKNYFIDFALLARR